MTSTVYTKPSCTGRCSGVPRSEYPAMVAEVAQLELMLKQVTSLYLEHLASEVDKQGAQIFLERIRRGE